MILPMPMHGLGRTYPRPRPSPARRRRLTRRHSQIERIPPSLAFSAVNRAWCRSAAQTACPGEPDASKAGTFAGEVYPRACGGTASASIQSRSFSAITWESARRRLSASERPALRSSCTIGSWGQGQHSRSAAAAPRPSMLKRAVIVSSS